MSREYLNQVLSELDAGLTSGAMKGASRGARVEALTFYERGLKEALGAAYPDKFIFDETELTETNPLCGNFYHAGKYVGNQFGELEVESASEFLLAEIGKRRAKLSRPGLWERLRNSLSESSQPRYIPRVFWQKLRDWGKEK